MISIEFKVGLFY